MTGSSTGHPVPEGPSGGPSAPGRPVRGRSAPSGHTYLDFNAPLSDAAAADLVAGLQPLAGARVVDLGCGWGELLLRVLAGAPTAHGLGIDIDAEALERGRTNAQARGLVGRVRFEEADVAGWRGDPADVLIAIGVSHAWGGTAGTLKALHAHVRPGGRLLLGDAVWEQPPTPEALAGLHARAEDFGSVADLVDLAMATGYRLLGLRMASLSEWDSFESRWCAGYERWIADHADSPDAIPARARVDEHRDGWLRGYRGTLGFAYLTLARS